MSKVKVKVVIGANYGDEGKGLATDYFSKQAKENGKESLNVLFNGSCQRGHTVELPNGKRHVFHHLGSGTLQGADTYFDRNFIVNPIFFVNEYIELQKKKICYAPKVYIHSDCRLATPFDSIINQIVELSRGDNRHGSCGFGVWETQKRYENKMWNIPYGKFMFAPRWIKKHYLSLVAQKYVPERLKEYGIINIPTNYQKYISDKTFIDNLIDRYLYDLDLMHQICELATFKEIQLKYNYIIFEGAQGLMLDEDNVTEYPNVTASSTTPIIPLRLIKGYNYDVEVCYITRSYLTRHGAGKFPQECKKEEINPAIEDKTNLYNSSQGHIRYGKLDIDEFIDRVNNSISKSKEIIPDIKTSVFCTHLNYVSVDELKPSFHLFDKKYLSNTKYADDVIKDYSW